MSEAIWECWSPVMQAGFAAFSVILLVIIVWLIKQLLKVLGDNNEVLAGNTAAIKAVVDSATDTKVLMKEIRDQLLQRPCLMPEEDP
ncbi:MAG: hypothetical protein HQ581_14915 [Planctomycetes bacterium]|nr:hypothetical protein [Planctomycetota bacterium]